VATFETNEQAPALEDRAPGKPTTSIAHPLLPQPTSRLAGPQSFETYIALVAALGIATHLGLRYLSHVSSPITLVPLYLTLIVGGLPLVVTLFRKLITREFGSDLLAGISIFSSVLLGQYLVGAISS